MDEAGCRIGRKEPRRLIVRTSSIKAGKFRLELGGRTLVMGVLNVTPDSFSDGGKFFEAKAAVMRAFEMAREGADIIDVGGESTRPGAAGVSEAEELRRVVPVIRRLASSAGVPISVDTRKAAVAKAAIEAGACIVNDISGLSRSSAVAEAAAGGGAALILMHMKGSPADMQNKPAYKDLIGEILNFLRGAVSKAKKAGVPEESIIIDPGIGFGKTVEHNLRILNRLEEFMALGLPICVGTSRKSFIGKVLGIIDPADRLSGTLASSVMAIANGADIIRVHDVKESVRAARMADSITKETVV